MTDFAKAKIAFALAMVGVLFAVHPIVQSHGEAGYDFFGMVLQVQFFYFAILGFLGSAVYFYALDFITESPIGISHRIGNFLYALSLIVPPLYIILWLTARLANVVVFASNSAAAGAVVQALSSVLSAVAGALISLFASRLMNRKDRQSSADHLATQEGAHLQRAEQMLAAGHSDLAVSEAFRSIEHSLRRALLDAGLRARSNRPADLIQTAAAGGIIPEDVVDIVQELRIARNNAVHGTRPIAEDQARLLIEATKDILRGVRVPKKGDATMVKWCETQLDDPNKFEFASPPETQEFELVGEKTQEGNWDCSVNHYRGGTVNRGMPVAGLAIAAFTASSPEEAKRIAGEAISRVRDDT